MFPLVDFMRRTKLSEPGREQTTGFILENNTWLSPSLVFIFIPSYECVSVGMDEIIRTPFKTDADL